MTARALIIAIENYPKSSGLANQLEGTNAAAQRFYDWLVGVKEPGTERIIGKQVDPKNIIACVEDVHPWRTDGTTRPEILEALDRFVTQWRDKTGELFFYFSGHGFSFKESGWGKPVDVLVTSEYLTKKKSGGACLKLQEVQEQLYKSMGPGDHYYFIEACRNLISMNEINVTDTGYAFDASEKKKPYRYTLFATVSGEVSQVAGGFTDALVEGLYGKGRAKQWEDTQMFVTFDRLCDYVEQKVAERNQEVDPHTEGNGKGFILELDPIPENQCEIVVDNATPDDQFTGVVKTVIGPPDKFEFKGPTHSINLRPFDYTISLEHASSTVERVKPPPSARVDFYDPVKLHFIKRPRTRGFRGSIAPGLEEAEARLQFTGAEDVAGAEVLIEEVGTGQVTRQPMSELLHSPLTRGGGDLMGVSGGRPQSKAIQPGTYIVKVRERGMTVSRQKVTIKPGEQVKLDLLKRPKSPVKECILEVVTGKSNSRVAVFAKKELGAMASWDLGLWLSLFGAARILGSAGPDFEQLSNLSLASFDDAKKDDTFVYVLAGFEKMESNPRMALSQSSKVAFQPLQPVEKLDRIYHLRQKTAPGSHLLSIDLPGRVQYTFSTYCLPNRATLFIIAENEKGQLTIHQYLLPIRHLFQYLPEAVLRNLNQNPLAVMRLMFLAQTRFARKDSIEMAPQQGDQEDQRVLRELIDGKWLDPVMSLIAAYDVIRQEGTKEARGRLSVMVANLRKYFGGIPDIEIIAKMIKLEDASQPPAPPLLLEGLLTYDEGQKKLLPLAANKLDYGTPWTTWSDAVGAKAAKAEPRPAAKTRAAKAGPAKKAGAKKAAARKGAKKR
jgi:hypothetical protein